MTLQPPAPESRPSGASRATGFLRNLLAGRRTPRDAVRALLRAVRFDAWGLRPVTQRRFLALLEADRRRAELAQAYAALEARCAEFEARLAERQGPPRLPEIAELRQALAAAEERIAYLRRVTARSEAITQALVDEVQRRFHGVPETTESSRAAARMVADGCPPQDALAVLAAGQGRAWPVADAAPGEVGDPARDTSPRGAGRDGTA